MRYPVAALAVILVSAVPARAQFFGCASFEGVNRKLAGRLVDYTHNHGVDRRIYSAILARPRDLYVYLPPGYTPAKAYPLILYFHLAYVDENIFLGTDWIVEVDRLIRAGCIPPVIIAAPDGTIDGRNRVNAPHSLFVNGCFGRFADHILAEVFPFLTGCYSIRPEPQAHALLGVSAGAFGAMSIAIRRRDTFGVVATLAAPLNLRYSNRDGDYLKDFDPATYRWKTEYDPDEIVGVFLGGCRRVRAEAFMTPVFGQGPAVVGRVVQTNPADLLFSTDLQPGELAMYVNYAGRDNWNFDAQNESFIWLARSKGIDLAVDCQPDAKHNLRYFRANHRRAYQWVGQHLLPPTVAARRN